MQLEILENEDLSQYTTLRIGGVAKQMMVPYSVEELCYITQNYKDALYISGGSNILIANREFETVVNLKKFNTGICNLGNGRYRVGASVRLQRLINTINQDGYGGIEYLYSVPGLVGASVAMNAGGGEHTNDFIEKYVTKVQYVYDGQIFNISNKECDFSFRNSFFKKNKRNIIISVEFQFEPVTQEESENRKKDRLAYCKKYQESEHPNVGSVFKRYSYKIMRIMNLTGLGNKKGVHYSRKTVNWIINSGDSNGFHQTKRLIDFTICLHKLLRRQCETEIIIWE